MVAQPDGLQHIGPTSCETEMYTEIWLSEEEFLKTTWKWKQLPLKMERHTKSEVIRQCLLAD